MSPQYPDVSVILPVYGVEKYIEKCVQSLLSQTLKDVQFIFVDDRGPDESIAILKRTIAGHPRERQFTILTPEHNLGAGMARNYGLQRASGRYIAFVDSDDVIEPTMLEDLFNAAISSKADICCCQLQKYDPDGRAGDIMANPNVGTGILTHEKRAYILTHYVSLFASFIYSSDFIRENDILFPPDRAADDSYFVSCAWMKAKSVAYVDRPLYHYIVRPGSVTTTRSSEKYKKRLAVFGKLMDYAREHGVREEFSEEVDYMYLKKGFLSSVVNYVTNSSHPQAADYDTICQELLHQVPNYRSNSYYRRDYAMRLVSWMVFHCHVLATPLLRTYAKRKNIVS